jgi:hypothetical protein
VAQSDGPEQPEDESQREQTQAEREDAERESIWSIPASLKRLYFALFTTQVAVGAAWLIRTAVIDETLVGIAEKLHFVWQSMAPVAISSATFALTITDIWKTSMVLGSYLEEVLKKRRQKSIAEAQKKGFAEGQAQGQAEGRDQGRAEGRTEGRTEGFAQGITQGIMEENQRWLEWNRRREGAAAAGEEFNEPPPGIDSENEDIQR